MEEAKTRSKSKKGEGSFCIPRAALNALLVNRATAYEVCVYLTLARFTDESGQFSTASISAVNRYTGANKAKGGTLHRALARLMDINATSVRKVSNGLAGKAHAMVDTVTDLGPIVWDSETWVYAFEDPVPHGPHERARVLHVLPDFGEPPEARVWFSNNLVSGVGEFLPLKALKDAGDVAARLLLALYEVNDMETWGGVLPCGTKHGPWARYEPVSEDIRLDNVGVRLHRAKRVSEVASIAPQITQEAAAYWSALRALTSSGLVYEVVMVLNRNAVEAKFADGRTYRAIPDDAEPYYELDCRSRHGYKPVGEEGVGAATAKTAGELGHSVAVHGAFDDTYAALVPDGYGCMIAGIYRLRFRVANPKNAGVKGCWAGIHQRNREALDLVSRIRTAFKLEGLKCHQTARSSVEEESAH